MWPYPNRQISMMIGKGGGGEELTWASLRSLMGMPIVEVIFGFDMAFGSM